MNKKDISKSQIIEIKYKLESLLNSVLQNNNPNKTKIKRKASDIKEWLRHSQNEEFNVYQSKLLEMKQYINDN